MKSETQMGITLIPLGKRILLEDLVAAFPGVGSVFAADFYITGAETWAAAPGGWITDCEDRPVFNIDHHAPAPRMERWVSSGTLAADHVREVGVAADDDLVVINHCDADSVIASAILRGLVEPEDRFFAAVIAADHSDSGEENTIADALQALEEERDLDLSLRTLLALRDGMELPRRTTELLEKRQRDRRILQSYVEDRRNLKTFGLVTVIATFSSPPKGGQASHQAAVPATTQSASRRCIIKIC